MTIKKTIKTEEKIDFEIQTPCWFKMDGYSGVDYYQINSEDDVIEVKLHENYIHADRSPLSYIYESSKIFDGAVITEAEFNAALSEAIMKISGVEISRDSESTMKASEAA